MATSPLNTHFRTARPAGWKLRATDVILVLLVAALPFVPLVNGIPAAHDLPDHLAMATQFRQGLLEGHLYPRWYGNLNFGWGEPTAIYYPPGLYVLTAGFSALLGGSILAGLIAALGAMSFIGVAGVYQLTRPAAGRAAALLACTLYVLAPYRSFELYSAGLFSAYAAGCIYPWVLLALYRLTGGPRDDGGRTSGPSPTAGWAITYCLLVLFNMPAALLTTYLVAFWCVVETLLDWNWRLVSRVVCGGAWGALMAAAFLIPAVYELAAVEPPIPGGEETFRSNFLFVSSGSWMSPDLQSVFNRMGALGAGILAIASTFFLCHAYLSRGGARSEIVPPTPLRKDERGRAWLRLLITVGAASFFLTTPLSVWLWELLPFLHRVYMPWRLLDHVAVPAAALGGALVFGCRKSYPFARRHEKILATGRARTAALAAVGIVAVLSLGLDAAIVDMNGRVEAGSEQGLVQLYYQRTAYFRPAGTEPPDHLKKHPLIDVLTPATEVEVIEWATSRRRLSITAAGPARLALRTYYFPGWTARLLSEGGDQQLQVEGEGPSGRMLLHVPPGKHEVLVTFENTPVRNAAAGIACLALGIWIAALIARRASGTQRAASQKSRRPLCAQR
jgi:hypothetical protein